MKDELKDFYEKYKKYINLAAAGVGIYFLGYRRGYKTFQHVLTDACKIVNENITAGGI